MGILPSDTTYLDQPKPLGRSGWFGEPERHKLGLMGIKTGIHSKMSRQKFAWQRPKYYQEHKDYYDTKAREYFRKPTIREKRRVYDRIYYAVKGKGHRKMYYLKNREQILMKKREYYQRQKARLSNG